MKLASGLFPSVAATGSFASVYTVVWGKDYEAGCQEISPNVHADLRGIHEELSLFPYLGNPVIEGGRLYELEVSEVMGLLHVRLAYTVVETFVVLLDVLALPTA
jgi:hypothetical protein